MNSLIEAALTYASCGVPVFPLRPCTKEPFYGSRGFLDATTDPRSIRQWWSDDPDSNIGIPTGERSGLLVVDEDPRHGGSEALARLTETHGELPRTKTTKTGSGGRHHIFRHSPGIGNSSGKLGPGLDVRGEGGYIVAPPSRTTGAYESLDSSPPATPPEWLLELLREKPGGSGGSGEKPSVSVQLGGEPIPEGQRDKTLASIAGKLHDGSRSLEQLSEDLRAVNLARCAPPLAERDTMRIARSIHRREPSRATGPSPETLETLDVLNTAVLDARSWKGKAGKSDRAIYRTLLLLSRSYGRKMKHGVKVYVSERKLAELAGVSSRTVWKGKRRLFEAGLLAQSSEGSGPNAGALVLLIPSDIASQVRHSPTGGESSDSALLVSELLRLRWGVGRLGKSCAELLEHLAFYGSADIAELSEAVSTRRDNVRRVLKRLEGTRLVECSSERYTLSADFLSRLDAELEDSGIKRSERLQRQRHELQRQAYRLRLEERRTRRPTLSTPEPDTLIETPVTHQVPDLSLRITPALSSRRLPEHTKEVRVLAMCRRLSREDPDAFSSLRGSLRALGWELAGRGWTGTVYSPATLELALDLFDSESEPVPASGAA